MCWVKERGRGHGIQSVRVVLIWYPNGFRVLRNRNQRSRKRRGVTDRNSALCGERIVKRKEPHVKKKNRFYSSPVNVIDFTTLLEMSPNSGVLLSNICSASAILHITNFKTNISSCPCVLIISKTSLCTLQPELLGYRSVTWGNI
jgi:hypothetical protein